MIKVLLSRDILIGFTKKVVFLKRNATGIVYNEFSKKARKTQLATKVHKFQFLTFCSKKGFSLKLGIFLGVDDLNISFFLVIVISNFLTGATILVFAEDFCSGIPIPSDPLTFLNQSVDNP